MIVEILSCAGCGRKVVAVGSDSESSIRINHHKCRDRWKVVLEVPLSINEAHDMVHEIECLIEQSESQGAVQK